MTLKVRILPFLTTFAQLSARLKNFLGGWLLVLGLEEGLVECATVCVKSWVILCHGHVTFANTANVHRGLQGLYGEIGVRGFQIYGDCMLPAFPAIFFAGNMILQG